MTPTIVPYIIPYIRVHLTYIIYPWILVGCPILYIDATSHEAWCFKQRVEYEDLDKALKVLGGVWVYVGGCGLSA